MSKYKDSEKEEFMKNYGHFKEEYVRNNGHFEALMSCG